MYDERNVLFSSALIEYFKIDNFDTFCKKMYLRPLNENNHEDKLNLSIHTTIVIPRKYF